MGEHIEAAVLDELYSAPRAEFVALRTAHAKQARADGERELATRITALRKPSMAAWLLNRIAREHRADLDAAAELGEQLRAAHRELDGARLRELSVRRHEILDALLADARTIAASAGQRMSDTAAEHIRATVDAALRDPAITERIRTGRLDSAVLEDESWPAIDFTGPAEKTLIHQAKPAPDPAARERARHRAAQAAEAEQRANHALRAAQHTAAEASARVFTLRAELAEAARTERSARQELETAEHTAALATEESSAAHQALTDHPR